MMKKIIIAALASNGIIGKADGSMPWHVKEEFKHFKETTLGFPIIMGRKTFESLGKPLPGRENIIITANRNYTIEFKEVKIYHTLSDAYKYCEEKKYEKCFITGGAQIYRVAVNEADEMILSKMNFEAEGSVVFPFINEKDWSVTSVKHFEQFDVYYYSRRNV